MYPNLEIDEPMQKLRGERVNSGFSLLTELNDEEAKEKCMLELLHSLPDANYYTITFMIEHLVR